MADTEENKLLKEFSIDEDDLKILSIFQEKPNATHVEIAKKIHKSQPAVGARVTKLERKYLLATQKGVNFKKINEKLILLLVDTQARDPKALIERVEHCIFIINGWRKSGKMNMSFLLAGTSMSKLESIIDKHFRTNPDVLEVETSFIVDTIKDFIIPINWDITKYEDIPCENGCCMGYNHDFAHPHAHSHEDKKNAKAKDSK